MLTITSKSNRVENITGGQEIHSERATTARIETREFQVPIDYQVDLVAAPVLRKNLTAGPTVWAKEPCGIPITWHQLTEQLGRPQKFQSIVEVANPVTAHVSPHSEELSPGSWAD